MVNCLGRSSSWFGLAFQELQGNVWLPKEVLSQKDKLPKGFLSQLKDLLKGQDSILQLSPSAQAFPGVPMLQTHSTQGGCRQREALGELAGGC